jgi:hypothetical protein
MSSIKRWLLKIITPAISSATVHFDTISYPRAKDPCHKSLNELETT